MARTCDVSVAFYTSFMKSAYTSFMESASLTSFLASKLVDDMVSFNKKNEN